VLQHVLPKGFRRARNFGFLHPKGTSLLTLRAHPNSKRLIRLIQYLVGLDPNRALALIKTRPEWLCPCCGGKMKVLETPLTPLFTLPIPGGT